MIERIRHMVTKEFIHTFRDPRMKRIIFIAPVLQLLVFGYAVNSDVRHVATGIYDLDNTPASRDLIARFTQSGYFDVKESVHDDARALQV